MLFSNQSSKERSIFIDNSRILPKSIQIYKRLLHRLPSNHPIRQEIEAKIHMAEAGFVGECYVDNFLKQVTFPKHYAILKDIHIALHKHSYLQLDTLIITKKYIAILEIKNIKGKISFQRSPEQLIREWNGEISSFKCPEQQLKRHVQKLHILLKQLKINLPIKSLIVLAYSKTHVALPPQLATITMGCDIATHIEEFNSMPDILSTQAFNKLLSAISLQSTEFIPKPLAPTHQLDRAHIATGLICPSCHLKITTQNHCPSCKISKRLMQQQAIEDWFYLYKDTISNSECVHFLELKDKFAANYLLNKLNLDKISHYKSRRYSPTHSFWLRKESSPT